MISRFLIERAILKSFNSLQVPYVFSHLVGGGRALSTPGHLSDSSVVSPEARTLSLLQGGALQRPHSSS
jgi:hypothetical protein